MLRKLANIFPGENGKAFINNFSQLSFVFLFNSRTLNCYQMDDKLHLEKKIQLLKIEYEGQIDSTNQKLTELSTIISKDNREMEDKDFQINTLRGENAGTINYYQITLII